MTEEEKKAISKLREIIEYDKKHRLETIYDKEQIEFRNNIELVLDLIEKLQKENEELKEKKVTYLNKVYNKIDNFKYEYKKAEMHYDPERASFYRDLIRHFEKLLEEE